MALSYNELFSACARGSSESAYPSVCESGAEEQTAAAVRVDRRSSLRDDRNIRCLQTPKRESMSEWMNRLGCKPATACQTLSRHARSRLLDSSRCAFVDDKHTV